jgi:hypothetical protein
MERLEVQHNLLDLLFDGRKIFPPLDTVDTVLDLGYGTAVWPLQIANSYPESKVI